MIPIRSEVKRPDVVRGSFNLNRSQLDFSDQGSAASVIGHLRRLLFKNHYEDQAVGVFKVCSLWNLEMDSFTVSVLLLAGFMLALSSAQFETGKLKHFFLVFTETCIACHSTDPFHMNGFQYNVLQTGHGGGYSNVYIIILYHA